MNPLTTAAVSIPLEGLNFTSQGLEISADLNLPDWKKILTTLKSVKHAYHCALADVINYGRSKFGEAATCEALEQLEFDMSDTAKAIAIGTIGLDFRHKHQLTSEHYFVIANHLKEESDRNRWAALAGKERLTPLELKRSIEAGRVIHTDEIEKISGQKTGITTVHGAMFHFKQWTRQIGGVEAALNLPEKDRRELLKTLSEVTELAERIRQSLP